MNTISDEDLSTRYPTPLIRGARISRLGEHYIGPAASDAATCRALGEEQLGWFIGGMPTYDRMIEFVRRVDASHEGGRWIVVPATRFLADVAYQIWIENNSLVSRKTPSTLWHRDKISFCVPERLNELHDCVDATVAGIILLDPNCIVHRGRGFGNNRYRIAHDRPQLIVDFKSELAIGRWTPPLFVMSLHKAAAVPTEAVARIYGLEALHFIEGVSLRCGAIEQYSKNHSSNKPGQISPALVS